MLPGVAACGPSTETSWRDDVSRVQQESCEETGGTEDDLAARGTHDPLKLPQAARLKPLWPRRRVIVVQHSVHIKEQEAGTSVSWTLADVYAAAHAALVLRRDAQLDHWGAAAP